MNSAEIYISAGRWPFPAFYSQFDSRVTVYTAFMDIFAFSWPTPVHVIGDLTSVLYPNPYCRILLKVTPSHISWHSEFFFFTMSFFSNLESRIEYYLSAVMLLYTVVFFFCRIITPRFYRWNANYSRIAIHIWRIAIPICSTHFGET